MSFFRSRHRRCWEKKSLVVVRFYLFKRKQQQLESRDQSSNCSTDCINGDNCDALISECTKSFKCTPNLCTANN